MKAENIKFRGKSKRTGEWLYGDLVRNVAGDFAIVPPFEMTMNNYCGNYEVDKETIGQFIGILSGSMVLEQLYGIPGIGTLFVTCITRRDYNVLLVHRRTILELRFHHPIELRQIVINQYSIH